MLVVLGVGEMLEMKGKGDDVGGCLCLLLPEAAVMNGGGGGGGGPGGVVERMQLRREVRAHCTTFLLPCHHTRE
jgi:hypothetical protein